MCIVGSGKGTLEWSLTSVMQEHNCYLLPTIFDESYMKSRSHCFGSTMLPADQTTMDSSSQSNVLSSAVVGADIRFTCTGITSLCQRGR